MAETKTAKFAAPTAAKKAAKKAAKTTTKKEKVTAAQKGEHVGRRAKFEDDAKLKAAYDAKNPPYREGSARMVLLEKAAKAGTVAAYLKAAGEPSGGSATSYLNLFVKEGFIKVS